MSADLYGKGPTEGEPHSLLVVAHPRDIGDAPEREHLVGRHPTYPEVIDAADLLAPGVVFHTLFVACPVGVEREPVEVGGALGIQSDQVGHATKSPLIHAASN